MATESFKPVNSTEGFVKMPNTAAGTLEEVLGINFGESYPGQILLHGKNKLRLLKDHPISFSLFTALSRFHNAAAFYDPEYDAYFVYPEEVKEATSLHENLHGWLARQNSDFALSDKEMTKASRADSERIVVLFACGEGLAEYGTKEALLRLGQGYKAMEIEERLLYGYPYTDPEIILEREGMKQVFARLEQGVESLSRISLRRGLARTIGELIVSLGIQDKFYPTGFFFSKFVVESLMKSGMDFANAYKLLAQNIPTTLNELKRPEVYAQKLLGMSAIVIQ